MAAETSTNRIDESSVRVKEDSLILPAHPSLIELIRSAKAAVGMTDFLLPTDLFTNSDWGSINGWIVSPPLAETSTGNTTGERITWAGLRDRRAHRITSIGGRFSDTSFGGEGVSSILEIGVLTDEEGEDYSASKDSRQKISTITNHCIYASGLPISQAGEMVLIAGTPNFADFELTTSLQSFANAERGDFLLKVMVNNILQQSNAGKLTELVFQESDTDSPSIIRRRIDPENDIVVNAA